LHVSYAWIAVYLALRVLAAMELVPINLAIHALTVGAIGGLTVGMMTRTARGHTGRALEAGKLEVACYALELARRWPQRLASLKVDPGIGCDRCVRHRAAGESAFRR